MAQNSLVERMKGAAFLNVATYEEVEADTTATSQAGLVVLIAAVAQAVGGIGQGGVGIIGGALAALIGWLLWSGITYLIGDKLLGGTATWGELLRTIGFAQSPQILMILAFLPVLGGILRFGVMVWVLIAVVIAIRQALDFSTGKAVATALLGWLTMVIPVALLGGVRSLGM